MKLLVNLAFLLLAWLPLLPVSLAVQPSLAEALAELPNCALNCLATAIAASTCSATDQTCLCTNQPLQNNVTSCVTKACTIKEALFTKNITQSSCGAPIRDRSGLYSNIAITFGVISAATVLARLGYKVMATVSELGLDDWFILITLLSGVPSTIINVRGAAANGIGRDIWTLSSKMINDFARWFYILEVLYFAQVALLKLSLLFFYQRIFPGATIKWVVWATVAFDIAFGLAFVLVAIFQCTPIKFVWTKWDEEHKGTCVNINAMGWSNAAISIALDVWMLAIPLSQLTSLKLAWKKKVGVAMMFCVGTFVTVVSILRLHSLVSFANSLNPTWDNWDVANWSQIEINVGIMCANMPAMRVILVRLFPKILGTTHDSSLRKGYYNTTNRSRSRGAIQHLGPTSQSNSAPADKSIVYTKTYNVEYDDEASLVPLETLPAAHGRSQNGSNSF